MICRMSLIWLKVSQVSEWIKTNDRLPEEGVKVETKMDDKHGLRNEQQLVFKRNLWFYPDMSMYIYYTPTHWRTLL